MPDSTSVLRYESSTSSQDCDDRACAKPTPIASSNAPAAIAVRSGRLLPATSAPAPAGVSTGDVLAVPGPAAGLHLGEGDLPAHKLQQVPVAQQGQRHHSFHRWEDLPYLCGEDMQVNESNQEFYLGGCSVHAPAQLPKCVNL